VLRRDLPCLIGCSPKLPRRNVICPIVALLELHYEKTCKIHVKVCYISRYGSYGFSIMYLFLSDCNVMEAHQVVMRLGSRTPHHSPFCLLQILDLTRLSIRQSIRNWLFSIFCNALSRIRASGTITTKFRVIPLNNSSYSQKCQIWSSSKPASKVISSVTEVIMFVTHFACRRGLK
jgi:hypothetical protein